MKGTIKFFTPIWLTPSFARLQSINLKKQQRIQRIQEAYEYLHEWNDIPLSQLYGSVCGILRIKDNAAARSLIMRMNMDYEVSDVAKLIPLQPLSKISKNEKR